MKILDKQIRVEMSSHGGICLRFPAEGERSEFVIWNTIGGRWGVTRADNCVLAADGQWISSDSPYLFEGLVDAFLAAMGWPDLHQMMERR